MSKNETILVTGGAGFIGSHACVELLERGFGVAVVDNLENSREEALQGVREITGAPVDFFRADIRDKEAMRSVFRRRRIAAVLHFAGLKSVFESTRVPEHYYDNNVTGTLVLCEVMKEHRVATLVFSSSATVYGAPETVPVGEHFPLAPVNPYGRTKLMIEMILQDIHASDPAWRIALLRYFNPAGAHPSGLIGEDPADVPNNLFPYVARVALGKLKELSVYGSDYPTRDGTGVRDYIHVCDLAAAHVRALDALRADPGLLACNLGTGRGYSVLEVISAFSKACGGPIPYRLAPRREGDVAECYADPGLAQRALGWKATRGLDDMCADAWKWQSRNPDGYTIRKPV